jgi:hypothetical protein
MSVHTLTKLQYGNNREGPFRLYIYDARGYHSGGVYFDRVPRYPEDGELTSKEAFKRATQALADGLEVRITDGGDMLVYHARGATVLYPLPPGDFWHQVGAYDA